jgi:hypothetical protein
MAGNDGYLYAVPSDANSNDGRLRDPGSAASGGDATANGAIITIAPSAIPGLATGAANIGGQTITETETIIGGAGSGRASIAGQVLPATFSALSGMASGAASAGGQTVTEADTVIAGAPMGSANVAAQVVSVTTSVIDGMVSGGSGTVNGNAGGTTITVDASLLSGMATGAGSLEPQIYFSGSRGDGKLLVPMPVLRLWNGLAQGQVIVTGVSVINGRAVGQNNLDFIELDNDLLLLAA